MSRRGGETCRETEEEAREVCNVYNATVQLIAKSCKR